MPATGAANRLRVSGWIRTEALHDGYAGFGARYSGSGGETVDTVSRQRLSGTRAWTQIRYDTEVPDGITWLEAIGHVRGSGTAWFDDLRIEVNGNPLPEWTLPLAPAAAEIEALRPYTTPLYGIDAGATFADLRGLTPLFANARVVALGEANHGSGSFVRLKHRILDFVVHELGFTYFAIEDNQGPVRLVNDYVLTGAGNLDSLMAPLFTVSKTREMRALIEWMRAYNNGGGAPIEFVGVDMQEPTIPIDTVIAFLRRRDPAYLSTGSALYSDMRGAWAQTRHPRRSDSVYDEWLSNARAVHRHLITQRADYLNRGSADDSSDVEWAIQSANVALQSSMMMRRTSPTVRDSSMAANMEWHLARRPGSRAILSGHNGHIWVQPGAIGAYLRQGLGTLYRPIALTAFTGFYRARDIVTAQWGRTAHFPALPGSVEHALHSLGEEYLAVDLRDASMNPALKWLFEARPFRSTGTQGADYDFAEVPIAQRVDAILFVRTDEPAVPLDASTKRGSPWD